jgi:pimeloyl-ACP methyl ester carboxylesterase
VVNGSHLRAESSAYDQVRSYWMRILAATYGQTPGTDEYRVLYEPWGFAVEDVDAPIHGWHGDADHSAPLALVRLVIERVPNGALTVFPGEGHYLDARHHPELLEFLTGWR